MYHSGSILCINNVLHNRSTLQRGLFSDKLILWLYTRVRMCMCGRGWQWRRSNTAFNLTLIKTPKLIRLESVAIVRAGRGGFRHSLGSPFSPLLLFPLLLVLFSAVLFRFILSSSFGSLSSSFYFVSSCLPLPFFIYVILFSPPFQLLILSSNDVSQSKLGIIKCQLTN